MPLLEETGYMPTRKYVSGNELRGHEERISRVWILDERSLFGTSVRILAWDYPGACWFVEIEVGGSQVEMLEADFAVGATGLLNSPKIPRGFHHDGLRGGFFMLRGGIMSLLMEHLGMRRW